MGRKKKDKFVVLTDMLVYDHLGDMDFKVLWH